MKTIITSIFIFIVAIGKVMLGLILFIISGNMEIVNKEMGD
jgi:hypothetical protein